MQFFWVNLGTTFKEVRSYNFLWAPDQSKGAKTVNAGWRAVPLVKKGDVIFCNANGKLIHVAIAKDDAYLSPSPQRAKFKSWHSQGYKIDVELVTLPMPVNHDQIRTKFCDVHNDSCIPKVFTKDRTVAQKYMCAITQAAGLFLLQVTEQGIPELVAESSDAVVFNQKEGSIRQAIVNVRQGQAQFRKDVMSYWNNTCPVTGLNIPELLTASHIIPWVLSTPTEKVDVANGIALSPMADKLFDKGFISFDADGVLISDGRLTDELLLSFGIRVGLKVSGLCDKHLENLKNHRVLFSFN